MPKISCSHRTGGGNELLFFTYANFRYHPFAILYPIFALTSNPNAIVEICISEHENFFAVYKNLIDFYNEKYPGKVRYTPIYVEKILPNSVRFLVQPSFKAKYVYIGDSDIFILDENLLSYHLDFMKRHNSDFSNCMRNPNQLTGLHFIEYDKMYPVTVPQFNLQTLNDEVLLCMIMKEKGLRFPIDATADERKIHGVHISLFSRPPLETLTTFDEKAKFPVWGPVEAVEKYLQVRYSKPVKEFMNCIRENQVTLRRVVQFADMWAFFVSKNFNWLA